MVGALAGVFGWAISLVLPSTFVAPLTLIVLIALTGAIHVDGLMDAADALFASVPAARRLEIMHDPRHGTFAIVTFAATATLWLSAVAALPPHALPLALAGCGALARASAILNAFVLPYGRAGASARAFESRPHPGVVVLGFIAAAACAWWFPIAIAIAPLAILAALGAGRWAAGRLDGVLVGDVYGAIVVLVEVGGLCVLAVLVARA